MNDLINGHVKLATCTGTLWALLVGLPMQWLQTAISAAIAAAVSFIVSTIMRYLTRRFQRK